MLRFSPHYFNAIKIVTAFKYIFEETLPKLLINFGNYNLQNSHKTQYASPVCNFGFTAQQYSDKCWSNLPLKCHIFLTGNKQKLLYHLRNHLIHALVGLLGTSYQRKHNKMTSSLYQRIGAYTIY